MRVARLLDLKSCTRSAISASGDKAMPWPSRTKLTDLPVFIYAATMGTSFARDQSEPDKQTKRRKEKRTRERETKKAPTMHCNYSGVNRARRSIGFQSCFETGGHKYPYRHPPGSQNKNQKRGGREGGGRDGIVWDRSPDQSHTASPSFSSRVL